MIAGHYGVSFIAKALNKAIPLWVLFIAVQWVDMLWAVLVLLRIEKARIVPGITPINPIDFFYMPYTHSLVAVIFWSTVAAFLTCRVMPVRPGWPVALVVAGAVFSHWVLDFLVHRPVLPLYGDALKVGMGLYDRPALAVGLEVALLFGGIYLYIEKTKPLERVRRFGAIILGIVITGILGYVSFAPPLPTIKSAAAWALVVYVVLAAVAYWIEKKRVWCSAANKSPDDSG